MKKINFKKNIKLIAGVFLAFLVLIYITKTYSISHENYNINNEDIISNTLTQTILLSTKNNEKGPKPKPQKMVYITFDDGPSEYTDKILQVLENHKAKATFFMINGNMIRYPKQLKNIVNYGHTPGFHSVTHDIHKLYITPKHTVDEFNKCQQTLYNITGVNSSIMRLPYGSKPYMPTNSYKALVKSKYKIWDWNLDTEDWKSSPEQILSSVENYSRGKDEIVLLMHEKDQTLNSLDKMLTYLESQGYVFMKIDEKDIPKNYWLNSFKNNKH